MVYSFASSSHLLRPTKPAVEGKFPLKDPNVWPYSLTSRMMVATTSTPMPVIMLLK